MYNVVDKPIPPMQPFSEYLIATYGEANARAMTHSVVAAWSDIIDAGGDVILSKAGNITSPVLLMVGEYDNFAPPALAAQLAARLRTAEVLEAKGSGHENPPPEWLEQNILNWLKRQ